MSLQSVDGDGAEPSDMFLEDAMVIEDSIGGSVPLVDVHRKGSMEDVNASSSGEVFSPPRLTRRNSGTISGAEVGPKNSSRVISPPNPRTMCPFAC